MIPLNEEREREKYRRETRFATYFRFIDRENNVNQMFDHTLFFLHLVFANPEVMICYFLLSLFLSLSLFSLPRIKHEARIENFHLLLCVFTTAQRTF